MPGCELYAAVVFDFDGLILDTETPIFASWQWAYDAHDVEPLTHHEWAAQIGTARGLDVVGVLRSRAGHVNSQILKQRVSIRDEMLARQTIRPGVEDWLDQADALGALLAIASSSEADWVLGHLGRLGLRERFGPVLCRSERHAPKPEPDLYRAACEQLGVPADHSLAVEDSPHGIAAAKQAGLACVAVPNAVTAELDLSAADLVVESLEALSLAEVASRLA